MNTAFLTSKMTAFYEFAWSRDNCHFLELSEKLLDYLILSNLFIFLDFIVVIYYESKSQ